MISCFMTGLVDAMVYIENNWESLCNDIETGLINPSVQINEKDRISIQKKFKADPERAQELREEFKKGFDTPIAPRIWKNLKVVAAVGTGGFMVYTQKLKKYVGEDMPIDFLCYAASEALMGIPRDVNLPDNVLIPNSSFYEFLPEDEKDETKTLTMEQLEVGKKYEIILTNLSGFYRYKLNDVVEVIGFHKKSPRVVFAYRKSQLVNICGEKVTEQDLTWSIKQLAEKTGLSINEYALYPETSEAVGYYKVFIETDKGCDVSKCPEYSRMIDEFLCKANPGGYEDARLENNLAPALLFFSQPQTHMLYRDMMAYRGVCTNQLKPVKVIDNPLKEKVFLNMIEVE